MKDRCNSGILVHQLDGLLDWEDHSSLVKGYKHHSGIACMKLGKPSHSSKIVAVVNLLHLQNAIVLYNHPWRLEATDVAYIQNLYFSLRPRFMATLFFVFSCCLLSILRTRLWLICFSFSDGHPFLSTHHNRAHTQVEPSTDRSLEVSPRPALPLVLDRKLLNKDP
jgi:hypothetical protein